jgi:hypothetical protein
MAPNTFKDLHIGNFKPDDLNMYNCPSCGANSNLERYTGKLENKIAELEKEKAEYLPVLAWIARECTQVDGRND